MFAPSDSDAEFRETPSAEEVENVVKALQQELVVGAFDETLVRQSECYIQLSNTDNYQL